MSTLPFIIWAGAFFNGAFLARVGRTGAFFTGTFFAGAFLAVTFFTGAFLAFGLTLLALGFAFAGLDFFLNFATAERTFFFNATTAKAKGLLI